MSNAFHFEDFGGFSPLKSSGISNGVAFTEEQRLAAYDEGFKAGWDDAAAAQSEGLAAQEIAALQALNDLSFTLAEAESTVMASLEDLLREVAGSILPDAAKQGLPTLIAEKVTELAKNGSSPLVLHVCPEDRATIEPVVERAPGLKLSLIEDASLASGCAQIKAGLAESRIDLNAVSKEIQTAVSEFFAMQTQTLGTTSHAV